MPNTPRHPWARFPWLSVTGLGLMGAAGLWYGALHLDRPLIIAAGAGIVLGAGAVALLRVSRRSAGPMRSKPARSPAFGRKKLAAARDPLADIDLTLFPGQHDLKRLGLREKLKALRDHPDTPHEEKEAAEEALRRQARTLN